MVEEEKPNYTPEDVSHPKIYVVQSSFPLGKICSYHQCKK